MGKAIRFSEQAVRPTGRATQGVRGIKLDGDDVVIGMDIIDKTDDKATLLTIMENGLGKNSVQAFPRTEQRWQRSQGSQGHSQDR